MGEIVDLKPARLEENHEFVVDCCRYQENILTQANMKLKYRSFTDDVWEKLGDNIALLEAVDAERTQRIRSGQQKREKAQLLVTAAPDVMSKILLDDSQSARHRIDSAKALDSFAANGPEAVPASDRFQITINLNGDIERFDKSIAINADDVAPNAIDAAPVIAAIAKNKPKAKPKGDDDGDTV